jgi:hypothetical protein
MAGFRGHELIINNLSGTNFKIATNQNNREGDIQMNYMGCTFTGGFSKVAGLRVSDQTYKDQTFYQARFWYYGTLRGMDF